MKTIPSALASHYALDATTKAIALRVTRQDAQVYGFTSADRDVTISSVPYLASPGLALTSMALSAGLNVDNLELTTLDDGTVFTRAEVLGGVWRNAAFVLFRYNWASPSDGIEPLISGSLGEVYLRRSTVVAEMRGLQQLLQQPVGIVSVKNCRAHFADFPVASGVHTRCRLNVATFTFSATVTGVTSSQVFAASALGQAATYFNEGVLTWTTGNNHGQRVKVKTHASGGALTLALPMLSPVQVGDTFSIVAGCMKRLEEDCITKFNNVLNFQGEAHRPSLDELTKPASAAG